MQTRSSNGAPAKGYLEFSVTPAITKRVEQLSAFIVTADEATRRIPNDDRSKPKSWDHLLAARSRGNEFRHAQNKASDDLPTA